MMYFLRGLYVTTKNIIISKINPSAFLVRHTTPIPDPPVVPTVPFTNGVKVRDAKGAVVTREYPPWLFRDAEKEAREKAKAERQRRKNGIADLIEGWETGRYSKR